MTEDEITFVLSAFEPARVCTGRLAHDKQSMNKDGNKSRFVFDGLIGEKFYKSAIIFEKLFAKGSAFIWNDGEKDYTVKCTAFRLGTRPQGEYHVRFVFDEVEEVEATTSPAFLSWDVITFDATADDGGEVKFGSLSPIKSTIRQNKKMTFYFDSLIPEDFASSVSHWAARYVPDREFAWNYDNERFRVTCSAITLSKNSAGFHIAFKLIES